MKRDSVIDYASCVLFRLVGPLIRCLPAEASLALGRLLGDIVYALDVKHRSIAYTNIREAFCREKTPAELSSITRGFFRHFGQNLIEIFFIPRVDQSYISRYIEIENLHYIQEAFSKGRGLILLGVHEGSWELTNVICATLGFPFSLFVREQSMPRLNRLLNVYRLRKGCRIIRKKNQLRALIEELLANGSVGMTLDQGGRHGEMVSFFGRNASMATGAVKVALKYGAAVVPSFYARIRGPRMKIILGPPFEPMVAGSSAQEDLRVNLQRLTDVFERRITQYPQEYLWTYKVWKYSDQRRILILDDGRTGHLRQSQSVAGSIQASWEKRGKKCLVRTQDIRFRDGLRRSLLPLAGCFSLPSLCQGCLACLRQCLTPDTYEALIHSFADCIVSCGSSLAAVNLIFSRECRARSVVIMKPPLLRTSAFDMVVAPGHDRVPGARNVVITEGAPNLINRDYLAGQACRLQMSAGFRADGPGVGLLIGGDTKDFRLDAQLIRLVVRQAKAFCERHGAFILATTSRRTSSDVEKVMVQELEGQRLCRLLVIANEKNIPEAVGGILGLSRMAVVSAESVSMVSEAASSGAHVVVFRSPGLSNKHQAFLERLNGQGYIRLSAAEHLAEALEDAWLRQAPSNVLDDASRVTLAADRLL